MHSKILNFVFSTKIHSKSIFLLPKFQKFRFRSDTESENQDANDDLGFDPFANPKPTSTSAKLTPPKRGRSHSLQAVPVDVKASPQKKIKQVARWKEAFHSLEVLAETLDEYTASTKSLVHSGFANERNMLNLPVNTPIVVKTSPSASLEDHDTEVQAMQCLNTPRHKEHAHFKNHFPILFHHWPEQRTIAMSFVSGQTLKQVNDGTWRDSDAVETTPWKHRVQYFIQLLKLIQLKKNFLKKIFGYEARCEFWLKLVW